MRPKLLSLFDNCRQASSSPQSSLNAPQCGIELGSADGRPLAPPVAATSYPPLTSTAAALTSQVSSIRSFSWPAPTEHPLPLEGPASKPKRSSTNRSLKPASDARTQRWSDAHQCLNSDLRPHKLVPPKPPKPPEQTNSAPFADMTFWDISTNQQFKRFQDIPKITRAIKIMLANGEFQSPQSAPLSTQEQAFLLSAGFTMKYEKRYMSLNGEKGHMSLIWERD